MMDRAEKKARCDAACYVAMADSPRYEWGIEWPVAGCRVYTRHVKDCRDCPFSYVTRPAYLRSKGVIE